VSNNLLGYFSVRRKPNAKAVQQIQPLYRQMLQLEKSAGANEGMENAIKYLTETLDDLQTTYDDFVLNLQNA
jgi:hypothetical protein